MESQSKYGCRMWMVTYEGKSGRISRENAGATINYEDSPCSVTARLRVVSASLSSDLGVVMIHCL